MLLLSACSAPRAKPEATPAAEVALAAGATPAEGTVPIARVAPVAPVAPEPVPPEGVGVVAVPLERYTSIWQEPGVGAADFAFDTRNPLGRLAPMLVADAVRRGGETWYEVYLPLRPNGTTAWVSERDVELRERNERIEVDLSRRLLRHYVNGELVVRLRVGVGTEATPTATGTFYVWVKVRYDNPYQPYGIMALGLSGFSPVLTDWPGGGRMAVHGTPYPSDRGQAVSHGCVRVYNDEMKALLDVPLGTPVIIRH
jgi:lipoprotein-anchoring transpeptidase ErfK/SrfK